MSRCFHCISVVFFLSIATIVSAQDSCAIRIISRIQSAACPSDVYTNSEVGYLCPRGSSIIITDLTNPYSPRIATRFTLGASWATHCNVGYSVCMVANGNDGIRALDMSDFNNPVQLSLFGVGAFASDLVYYPPYVFVATYGRGLVIVNYANLNQGTITGVCAISGSAYSVVVRDDYAYVSSGDGGLSIVNVQYLVAPTLTGRIGTGFAYKSALYGDLCYVASGTSGVRIVNVANPAAPVIAATIPSRGLANHVEILDHYLYVSYYGSGIAIYNLQPDSLHPTLTGWYNNGGSVHAVTAWRNFALASNTNGYFNVFDCSEALGLPLGIPEQARNLVPTKPGLKAYPNPFNAITTIEYSLPKSSPIEVKLYDLSGREIRSLVNLTQRPGTYRVLLDANNLPSGNYFCRLKTGTTVQTKTISLVK